MGRFSSQFSAGSEIFRSRDSSSSPNQTASLFARQQRLHAEDICWDINTTSEDMRCMSDLICRFGVERQSSLLYSSCS